MAVRVAELETIFTGDLSDVEAKAKKVQSLSEQIDKLDPNLTVEADILEAMAQLDKIETELDSLDGETATVEAVADVEQAITDLDDVAERLGDLDTESVTAEVDVDASGAQKGLRDAEDGLGEFKDEAGSTAREAAASFDGSAESIGDVFQELAANAFAGFGPAGAAAGLAVAVGLGTAIAAAQELAEANTAAKESAADIAVGMTEGVDEASQRFQEWATEVREDNAWTFWKDEATTNIQAVTEDLESLGADGAAAIAAISSGSLTDMQDQLFKVSDEVDMLTSKLRQSSEVADSGSLGGGAAQLLDLAYNAEYATQALGDFTEADRERLDSLKAAKEVLEEQIGAQEDAEEIAVALLVAQENLTEEEAELELAMRRTNGEIETRNDLNQSSIEASLDLADGLAELTAKEDDWKASLNDGTQAGRDNIREILDLTDNIQALGEVTLEQTGSQEQANAAMRDARGDLLNTAEAAGFNREKVAALIDEVLSMPDEAGTDIYANDHASRTINGVQRELDRIPTYVGVDIVANPRGFAGAQAAVSRVGVGGSFKDGGIVARFLADGDLIGAESHTAQIAPAGAWRVWAEPETGGEAYIPLSPAKRPRSMAILEQVAREFGAQLTTRANGAVDLPAGAASTAVAAGPRVVQHITVNYPVAEPTSVTTNRALQYAAATGV